MNIALSILITILCIELGILHGLSLQSVLFCIEDCQKERQCYVEIVTLISIFHVDFTLSDIEPVANWNALYNMRNLIHIFIPCQLDENLAKTTLEYPNLKKYLREKKNKIDYKILVKHNKGSKLSEVVIHKACYGSSESQWWHKHRFLVPLIEYMWYVRKILVPIKGFHIRRWDSSYLINFWNYSQKLII
jgi:hypothetical protein